MASTLINPPSKSGPIQFISYNMHGFNQGSTFLANVCVSKLSDFIFIQEHWLTPVKMSQILNFSKSYLGFGISAMDSAISQSILRGRPFGGVAILVRKYLTKSLSCLKCSDRFVILLIDKTVFINVYFPCSTVKDYLNILLAILTNITVVLEEHLDCEIVLGGDFNTNLHENSPGSNLIRKFMIDFGLVACNDILPTNCNYTYKHESLHHKSYVDFFLVSSAISNTIAGHCVLDEEINFSDHLPISLDLYLQCNFVCDSTNMPQLSVNGASGNNDCVQTRSKSFRWDHANLADYYAASYTVLQPVLNELNVIGFDKANNRWIDYSEVSIINSTCNYYSDAQTDRCVSLSLSDAIQLIERLYKKVTVGLYNASKQTIPVIDSGSLKFWWDQELSCLKAAAICSNKKWIAAGKPSNGPIFDEKKQDKYAYRNGIRQKKKKEHSNFTNSLHETLLSKNHLAFWKSFKSKFGNKPSLSRFINGKSGDYNIANEFAASFANACSFNSERRKTELHHEFLKLKRIPCPAVRQQPFCDVVTVELLDNIINKLKRGKAASVDNITAEHIKFCHPIVVTILAKLFALMSFYEYVPNDFGSSLTVAIPKGDSCTSKTDDYRGITVSPVISKIFEHSLMSYYSEFLYSADFQFGFKEGSSCSQAVYTVRKTIEYFIERDSTVSVCAIDLAKAFDKVNKYALFIKLIKRGCPMNFINLLDSWYDKCFTCVKWGDSLSNFVKLNAGVRQGGVLSPALFAVYVNDVLVLLKNSKLGCHINQFCCNAFMYADDLLLLSISVSEMQKMIDICVKELDWLDMKVNVNKSSFLRIGKRFKVPTKDIVISCVPLSKSDEIRYLGIYIERAATFRCNMHYSKVKYFRCLNGILGKIGTCASADVILSLVSSFATPVLLYCLETACLNSAGLDKLNFPFRSIYVKLFSTFDCKIIEQCQYFTWQLPLKLLVHLRCLNFFHKLNTVHSSPASLLFHWLGKRERDSIASLYGISKTDRPCQIHQKIWDFFAARLDL